MKSLLERLKLVDYLTTEISIDKREFVEKLKKNIDQGDTGTFFSAFEAFSSSKNEYKGTVTPDSFKLRRRRKMFDMNRSLAIAEGTFRQKENLLVIEATISGFRSIFIPFIVLLLLLYVTAAVSFSLYNTAGTLMWFMFPFMLVHASLMLGIPYFVMRRSVSRMKYELERDFYYITKN
ncbi:hypothetical protein KK083_07295 [Fulvivirgaceae bacterium PWU4]|uniref:Uncharacterized protein n=1 Tax=Chryseosolibacter histidini TaxID=2782349 RepID=A0AAP2DKI8_9BACT|nr:hypothetical protein [Chryseosolibacter histidini]MBT1696672.1 hypothetical protein [Chryseosolibacter histidini]